jgi:hypothetical protein
MSNGKPAVPIAIRTRRLRPPPNSGNGYRHYADETVKWSQYLKLIADRITATNKEHGAVSYVARTQHVPQTTLNYHWRQWRDRIRQDGFTTKLIAEINAERRGGSNKALTNDEEHLLDTQLASINEDAHMEFTSRIIKRKAQQIVARRPRELRLMRPSFHASKWWCTHFQRRYLMVSGHRAPKNRRKHPNPAEIATFTEQCQRWIKQSGTDFFFNIDESKWHLINPQRIVVKRRYEQPLIVAPAKIGRGFTVVFGANASGIKLRPSIIIKGDDDDCMLPYIERYGDSVGVYRSSKGWSNSDIMCSIIRNDIIPRLSSLRRGQRATLVLDKFSGHCTSDVQQLCDDNRIRLILVPGGATPQCQPMDISAIGATKRRAANVFTDWQLAHIGATIDINDAIGMMIQSWETIDPTAVTKGFKASMRYAAWPSSVANTPSLIVPSATAAATHRESKSPINTPAQLLSVPPSASSAAASLLSLSRKRPLARGDAVFDFTGMAGDAIIDPKIIDKHSSKRAKRSS